jgi:hypothetical protein
MDALVRWTIGPVKPHGFDCLKRAVSRFAELYPSIRRVVCHNGLTSIELEELDVLRPFTEFFNQDGFSGVGVAWKLYPARLNVSVHELFIDNDVFLEKRVSQIDDFLAGADSVLLLEGDSRNYGRFDAHVPPNFCINSGVFGVPPGFDLQGHLDCVGDNWEENCSGPSKTWDEQGFVAYALLSHHRRLIIPATTITNCEVEYLPAPGMHFVGLNRKDRHDSYLKFLSAATKINL